MKKKLLILSACIGLILACFPFTLCAEEDPQSDLGVSPPPAYYKLDDYFYENYTLLPYVYGDGTQYINTGINATSELLINLTATDISGDNTYLFGSRIAYKNKEISVSYYQESGFLAFNSSTYQYLYEFPEYQFINVKFDKNISYVNGIEHQFTYSSFENTVPIYVFSLNNNGSNYHNSSFKLYNFSIYDYDTESYLRYYYPARSKSGNVVGLYDAVSKTFFTSATASPFEIPDGSDAEMGITANITNIILSGLGWIGDILNFAITEPLIICFMAIGLAGAMFRWGRRLVHF